MTEEKTPGTICGMAYQTALATTLGEAPSKEQRFAAWEAAANAVIEHCAKFYEGFPAKQSVECWAIAKELRAMKSPRGKGEA